MRKLRFGIAAAAALIEAAIAVALVWSSDRGDDPWLTATFAVTAGLSFVAAGLVALWRRPENATGFLLAATGYLWFVAALGESNDEWVFTVGYVLNNLGLIAFALAILAYPDGTLTRLDKALVGAAGGVAILANLLGALVEEVPSGCDGCPASAIAVTDRPGLARAVTLAATVILVPLLAAIVVILVRRWRNSSPAERRLFQPVVVTCVAAVSLLTLAVLVQAVNETAGEVVWVLFLLSFAAVPLSFLGGVLRGRHDRAAASAALLALQGGVPLREALAEALHDPSLAIVYRLEETGRWVDAEGRQAADPVAGARAVTWVEQDGAPVAALLHDPALAEEPGLVDAVASATGLFLSNERLHAELRAQYIFLETIANTAPSLLVNVATDGRIVNQNRATLAASGLANEEEIRGRFFWDVFIDPVERDEMRARFAAAAPDFAPSEYENTFTNARGERRVIAWESAPVVDDEGKVVSIIAGGLDITERKQREDETRVAGERLEAVIDSAPVAILEVGLDDCVKGWNSAAERIFGWCAADVLGRPVPIVPPEYEQEFRELLQRIRAGHAYAGYETVRRRRDGSLVDVAISAAPIRDAGGAVIGHMAMFGDITERKQRELELRRESEFLRTTADTIESLLAVVDEDGEVVGHAVNKAFERRIGWSEDEMRGTSFLELFAPADRPGVLATIRAAAAGATVPERESRWQNRWGGHADVAWTATAVTDPAGRRQVLVSGTDVTERKRQEEEVRDSRRRLVQAADEARRELERDLHDGAQQRLVALSLSLRLAEAKLASDPDEAGRILGRAREELTHALEELRELARGIHPAVLTERGLNAALEALVTRAPLPVQLELADDRLPPPVEAAAYFVISEALTNVAKYAQATSAHVRVRAFNGLATVEVSDDGVGGADPAAGSGLRGLADRVAALDGTLQVESTGAGTRVVALLPVRAPAHAV